MSRLSTDRAKQLASESRRDPLTKQPFVVGQDVVLCATCNSAHLRTSWAALGKCPCGGTNCIDNIKPSPVRPVFSRRVRKRNIFILMLLSAAVGNMVGCAILAKMADINVADVASWWVYEGYLTLPFGLAGSFYATKLDVGVKRMTTLLCVLAWSWLLVWSGKRTGNLDVLLPWFIFSVLLFTLPSMLTAKCIGRFIK